MRPVKFVFLVPVGCEVPEESASLTSSSFSANSWSVVEIRVDKVSGNFVE